MEYFKYYYNENKIFNIYIYIILNVKNKFNTLQNVKRRYQNSLHNKTLKKFKKSLIYFILFIYNFYFLRIKKILIFTVNISVFCFDKKL